MSEKCGATTNAGTPCGAWALRGSDPPRCFQHAAETARDAAAARSKGGRNRATPAPASEPTDLGTPAAQLRTLETAVDRMLAGDQPTNVTRTTIYAVATAKSVLDNELLERIETLEEKILEP